MVAVAARAAADGLTIQSIQAALMSDSPSGRRKPSGRVVAFWNVDDNIAQDKPGLDGARNLGARVAEVARAMAG